MSAKGPQVYVNVSGGIAETTVMRGIVDVVQVDWDNENDKRDPDELRETRVLLERLAPGEYKTRLLRDIDHLITEAIEDEEERLLTAEERRQERIAAAKALLEAEGEL